MKFLVQKFGGTSLVNEDLRLKVASRVVEAKKEGYFPVVVVSAIGRLGEPYATDTLLSYAGNGNKTLTPARVRLADVLRRNNIRSGLDYHDAGFGLPGCFPDWRSGRHYYRYRL